MDPHRVLGVSAGASEDEIKRAYRALAKRHHPDARQGSVARFLEVQDAYEALVAPGPRRTGDPPAPRDERPARRPAQPGGRSREGGDPTAPGAGGAPAGAAWARRPRGDGARRSDGQGAGPEDPAGRRGAAGPQHASDPGGRRGPDASPRGRRPGGRRRATLGSTSYDEAEELFEPGWAGASWYGPTSGTYWTVNPKEYADPRKHGPEYQARARSRPVRSTRGAAGGEQGRDGGEHGPGAGEQGPGVGEQGPVPHPPDAAAPSPEARAPRPDATAPRAHAWAPRPATATRPPISDELAEERPGLSARLAMALLGWAVPGVALAAAAGFPGGLLATLPLQVAGVVALAAAPRAAWATAAGGVVLVIAALPIVALVSALGGPIAPGQPASPVAVALAVTAWAAGVLLSGSGRLAPYPWPAEP